MMAEYSMEPYVVLINDIHTCIIGDMMDVLSLMEQQPILTKETTSSSCGIMHVLQPWQSKECLGMQVLLGLLRTKKVCKSVGKQRRELDQPVLVRQHQ